MSAYAKKTFLLENGKLIFTGSPAELFDYASSYDRLDIPEVVKLATKLNEKGMNIPVNQVRDVNDLLKYIKEWRNHHG